MRSEMIVTPWIARVEADPVRISVGLAAVSGAAAIIEPPLAGLTFALFALAVASHLFRRHRSAHVLRRPSTTTAGVYACLAAGIVGYFALPSPWEVGRALTLALSAIPLAYYSRAVVEKMPWATA